jgi:hypothetical protein
MKKVPLRAGYARAAAARLCGDSARRPLSRQQGGFAEQALRWLRFGHELAASLGENLGRRQVLFRRLPAPKGGAWLSFVP